MRRFAGRKDEINRILERFSSKKGVLVVIRGRRRIGKTRLIKELNRQKKKVVLRYLTATPPDSRMTDKDERLSFSQQVKTTFDLGYIPPHETWVELFEFIADICTDKNTILALDEINWLATKSPSFMSSFFYLWENKFTNKKNFMVILSGSLSSWIEENIIMNKGFVGRISLDIILKELKLNDMPLFFGEQIRKTSHFDLVRLISAIGTVPRYLEELNLSKTVERNLNEIAFSQGSFLYDEFEQMFNDLFSSRNKLYKNIIEVIGKSKSLLTPKEIMGALDKSYAGRDSNAFKILEESGFIKKQHLWNIKKQRPTRLFVLRISDNYIALYFRAIKKIKQSMENTNAIKMPNNLASILGLQFENVILNNTNFVLNKLHISPSEVVFVGSYTQKSTKIRKGCQVDLLIQTKRRIYICECKLKSGDIDKSIIAEIENKIDRIENVNGYTYHPVLIHANQVADNLIDAEYFDEIIDITDAFN